MKPINQLILTLFLGVQFNEAKADFFKKHDDGIKFKHDMGKSEDFYYPEIVGSGVALIDYDNDGDLDVYLVQSGSFQDNREADQIYKNRLRETGKISFRNESKKLGVNSTAYGIGVAVADINNDGWQDLLVTNLHENQILLNQSGKSFKLDSRIKFDDTWSASASFCDVNNDGWQDLYISNYVNWSESNHPKCYNAKSKRDYCGPNSFEGLEDAFFMNNKGKLENKTKDLFKDMPKLPGLNVICQDVNHDGWSDFIVANDGERNLLWLNQSGKFFKESGYLSGLAVNSEGKPEASMGIASADYDLDGNIDIFFTHLMNETNTLYKNNRQGLFQDVSNKTGLSRASYAYTGWATGFLHINDDIYPDLIIFNGAVADIDKSGNDSASLEQSNQLLAGSKTGKFSLLDEEAMNLAKNSRGAAFGDLDNDGDVDIVVNNNHAQAEVFLNQLNPEKWLGLNVQINGEYSVFLNNQTSQIKQQLNPKTDGSYASAQDNRLIINQAQLQAFDSISFYQNNKLIRTIEFSEIKTFNSYQKIKLK